MTTDIVKAEPHELAPASSILEVIARAAADPAVDVGKLERLLAIQERAMAEQRATAYKAAMARLQGRLPQVTKAGTILNRSGAVTAWFAKIEDVDVATRPLYTAEGFSLDVDSSAPTAAGVTYTSRLSHRDGHSESKTLTLPSDKFEYRTGAQNVGSNLSYARRYLLMMHLNLVTRDVDNDGAGECPPITAEQVAQLRRELAEVGGSEARFLVWLKVAALEEIPADRFKPALMFIEEKRKATK